MKNINPTLTPSWKKLKEHFFSIKDITIKDLFINDSERFKSFSLFFYDQMLVDFSKNRITQETLEKLFSLARDCFLQESIYSMFYGEKINITENRSVLHTALRNYNNDLYLDGKNIMDDVRESLKKIKNFSEKVINGSWVGYSGNRITDVVNIGIGGSNLGPYMVTEALSFYKNHIKIHFVSNVDGTHITETLKKLNPETTLFLIASKTFLTQETMTNACSARDWFLATAKNESYISLHFVALSANIKEVIKFGINTNNMFPLWDWVCGRYSLWSVIGLSIALSIGYSNFEKLLMGAHDMDQHFLMSPLEKNIPVILALIGIWYNNFFNMETEAVIPYDQYMHKFPDYLQQISMESNGKCIDRNGFRVKYQTGPIVWGESGTDGQHSFYQLLHQGTKIVPCDFIAPVISHNFISDHHEKLLSNFFAQTEALAFGKSQEDFRKEHTFNLSKEFNFPFRIFEGNRPTNSILIRKITPYNLGALIALYEHKIFTQGAILNIFSFDQWGVELGKELSEKIFTDLKNKEYNFKFDVSTNGLLNQYTLWKNSNDEN